jgi:RHS repeat-associated protein
VSVTYDALGRMVELNRSGTYTEIAYAPTGGKLALMSGQTLQKAFVPLPGGATAVYTSSGLDHYRHSDWLGSARLTTTPSRTVYGEVAYAPYGETYAASGNNDFSWTGINADVEPANPETLYDFPAREYGIQGRWPSPDPLGIGAVDPSDPQSWNRYAYVRNNPLAMEDPTGMGGELGGICATNPIACVIGSLLEGLFFFFGHHHHVTPHAAPAPPGGYGGGIDPYGTWDETIPNGVQVFPHIGFPGIPGDSSGGSGCTYGSGNCGGGVYGFISCANGGCTTTWHNYADYLDWLLALSGPNVSLSPGLQLVQRQVRSYEACASAAEALFEKRGERISDAAEDLDARYEDPFGGPLGPDTGMSPEIPDNLKNAGSNSFLIGGLWNAYTYRANMRKCAAQNPLTTLVP